VPPKHPSSSRSEIFATCSCSPSARKASLNLRSGLNYLSNLKPQA